MACAAVLIPALAHPAFAAAPAGRTPVQRAEALALAAVAQAASDPKAALVDARAALALTADFEPTAFVRAGRRGEVVEDAYQAARDAYRQHRAVLYEAVGTALAAQGSQAAAVRYLRRAFTLAPAPEAATRLARSLLAVGRGPEALGLLLSQVGAAALPPEGVAVFEQASDAAGLPSAQAELDRARARALSGAIEYREGPYKLPVGSRLSTGAPLRLDQEITVLYLADTTCRTCSADLQELRRIVPEGTRVLVVPEDPDRDQALRQVLQLYKYDWPVVLGRGVTEATRMVPATALVVGRQGWVGLSVKRPFAPALVTALTILGRRDVQEALPRASWNRRPVERRELVPIPGPLEDGLFPGEDDPAPARFTEAVAAFRARRFAEALRLFELLEAQGDGWLLPAEARVNRALALARLGRRDEARRLLLRTGDSREQGSVDAALELVGSR